MSDAQIIPINGESPIEQTAQALVLAKRETTLAHLARCSAAELAELQRDAYLNAVEQGLVSFVGLFIQTYGERLASAWTWKRAFQDGAGIVAHINDSGRVDVTVTRGGKSVTALSDVVAGAEKFIPGEWLTFVVLEEKRLRREAQHAATLTERNAQQAIAADMLAEI